MNQVYTTRRLDKLGRIVLPIEMRKILDIEPEDCVLVNLEDDRIILKKKKPGCCFCGEQGSLIRIKSNYICKKCLQELKRVSI